MFTHGFEKTSGMFDKIKGFVEPIKKAVTSIALPAKPIAAAAPKPVQTPSWIRQGVTSGKLKYSDVK